MLFDMADELEVICIGISVIDTSPNPPSLRLEFGDEGSRFLGEPRGIHLKIQKNNSTIHPVLKLVNVKEPCCYGIPVEISALEIVDGLIGQYQVSNTREITERGEKRRKERRLTLSAET